VAKHGLATTAYQSAGAGVAGSSGNNAPGMSFHRNCWKVRMR
jgi:hypothetical protein